jgi:hypothetical protein
MSMHPSVPLNDYQKIAKEKALQQGLLQSKLQQYGQAAGAAAALPAPVPTKPKIVKKKKKASSNNFLSNLKKTASKTEEAKQKHSLNGGNLACDTNIKKTLNDPNVRITSNRLH